MLAALLATFFFSSSALLARRAISHLGSQRANFARQAVALLFLGAWAYSFGQRTSGPSFGLFLLSGMLGFGLGDWALFEALPRIGPGLTLLLCQCLAAPIGAITERFFLGTQMTALQVGSSALILMGVGLALAPGKEETIPVGHRGAGVIFGIIAATGQGWGAVLSRYAFQRAQAVGFSLDVSTSTYQRLMGGVLVIGFLVVLRSSQTLWSKTDQQSPSAGWTKAWPWVLGNGLIGAVIGVSCYQWALKSEPSSFVLPIVATSPLVAMLLAFALEGTRPRRRAVFGAVVAVTGVIILVRYA